MVVMKKKTLGAEVAIIVQSLPGKHVFAFGHSIVDSIISRFENGITSDDSVKNCAKMPDFKRDCSEVSAKLEAKKSLQQGGVNEGGGFWWDMEVEDLELDELEMFKVALEELKNLNIKAETSSSLIPAVPVLGIIGFTLRTEACANLEMLLYKLQFNNVKLCEDLKREKKMAEDQFYAMNEGNGHQSYAKNSSYQGGLTEAAKKSSKKKLAKNLTLKM
ncbi:unnamed protein product [Fraxinus pennsylvanica]|uniref:Agamous-like MADS-box protein AGL62 n=1 Tax=Fraxinus pennsylvanica TaxID=56036 RepID=A0AAD1ZG49_9LAMI|nr:unnamed protein product [Fraxinus pennsylvanica]